MVERAQQLLHPRVVFPRFDCNRALPWGRQPVWRVEEHRYLLLHLKAYQARCRENSRVNASFLYFCQPRRHVTAQLDDLEIGASIQQLRASPQAGRADARTRRQIIQTFSARMPVHHENVARVFALQQRNDLQLLGQLSRQILQRMHGAVDFASNKRSFDFRGEQTLPADGGEWLIEFLVAGSLERDELAGGSTRAERGLDESRLSLRKLGGSCSDADNAGPARRFLFRRH